MEKLTGNLAEIMRPKTLDEVIGQSHIVLPLKNQLENDTLSQTYLFTGPFGTGKSTFAYVIANHLNAEIVTIDCGNETIDDIRSFVDSSNTTSLFHDKKVFIFDECHLLSKKSQSTLLKVLEEPNSNSHFILLTNEPNKVLDTIKSRCVHYELLNSSPNDIKLAVRKVLDFYKIKIDNVNDLKVLLERSKGSLRVAYSLLEKLVYSVDKNNFLSKETIQIVLGKHSDEYEFDDNNSLVKYLRAKDVKSSIEFCRQLKSQSGDNAYSTILALYNYFTKFSPQWDKGFVSELAFCLSSYDTSFYKLEGLIIKYV